jgi:hypothetical protein
MRPEAIALILSNFQKLIFIAKQISIEIPMEVAT